MFFAETIGTENSRLNKLSQMVTYWFVIAWFDNQSVQKSEVKQAAKDVVKSKVYCSDIQFLNTWL